MESNNDTKIIFKKTGRPSIRNIPRDQQYFNNYYQQTKHDFTCECGMTLSSKSKAIHLKRPIHAEKLEDKTKQSLVILIDSSK
jgi:hypothetical protein